MKTILKSIYFLFTCLLFSFCNSPDNNEIDITNEVHSLDETPILEDITESSLENILNGFKISELIKYDDNISPTSNRLSKSIAAKTFSKDCEHEITNTYENKSYIFDITRDYGTYPLTPEEIQTIINAPVISTTESSIKYFLNNRTPSTDCNTEELNAPVPNHDNRDALLRPTFYNYSSIFDYTGEHHYSNKFYIERSEMTKFTGGTEHSKFITNGPLEKRVDRTHQVHFETDTKISHIEDLKLSGFIRSQEGYRFHFMDGSYKYFKHSYTIEDELGSPTYGNTEIDMVNRYVVQFYLYYRDGADRVDGVFRIPFVFDITIDYKEIIETLKENESTSPYTKTVPLYVKTGNTNRNIGNLVFLLDEEERWRVHVTESPLIISDSELEYIIDNFN